MPKPVQIRPSGSMRAPRAALALCAALGIALASAGVARAMEAGHTSPLMGPDAAPHGSITVTPAPKGVILRIAATGLPPGWHGMHFHEKGDCSDPKFTSAGAHVHGATPVVHGLMNADANDNGDLPNLYVGADGTATVEIYSTLVALAPGGDRPALMDADGAALVIHANPDDYMTQPIGGAGGRIACAVIK